MSSASMAHVVFRYDKGFMMLDAWELTIKSVEIYPVAARLVRPFQTSFGTQHLRECIIIRLETTDGAVGWGEVVASNDPGYSYETSQTALHILTEFLIPRLLAQKTVGSDASWAWLNGVRGHPLAKHGILSAILVALAETDGKALADLILQMSAATSRREAVQVGVSIGIQPTIDDTLQTIAGHVDEGYQRVKLKIKPGYDIDYLTEVRRAFPDLMLMADANSAYTLDDVSLLKRLDGLNLLMIEQPLAHDDIFQHSQLQPQLETPICLDESLHSLGDVQLAHHLGACQVVNLKPQRVGGLFEAVAIHDFCAEVGLDLWIGGMLETGIGRACSLALAALPAVNLPCDISETRRYYNPDIATPYFELISHTSTMAVPSGVGLGVQIDEAAFAEAQQAYRESRAGKN